jgi:hypothetical protein
MSDQAPTNALTPPPASAPPRLPDVQSPPPEDVLEGVPSTDEVIDDAQPASKVVEQQPDVDEILGRG